MPRCVVLEAAALVFSLAFTVGAKADGPMAAVAPLGPPRRVATGFKFAEGPTADAAGVLYFSDIPNQRIHRLTATNQVETTTDRSGHANGLMFNAAGELVACEMEGRLVAWNLRTNARRVLADSYGGKRFNSPNDLVIDRQGGIYFTDPRYTAPQPLPQGSECVYYVAANGNICRVIENLPGPNGVLLSTDENILYVLPMDDPKMLAYTIKSPGTVTDARVFCTLAVREHDVVPGCDGATLDERGNLYLTTVAGVEVYSPAGDHLIVIKLPEKPSNVAFGGHSFTTLYATSRTSVYAVPMNVAGHRYAQSGQASTTP